MGGILNKALNPFKLAAHTGGLIGFDDPFRTGASAQKRQAEEQAALQQQRMQVEQARFEQQQAAQEKLNAELKSQQEAIRNKSELQAKLAGDTAAKASDDTPKIQVGADLTKNVGTRKRKRRVNGSTALGL